MRGLSVLTGFRGKPPGDVAALAQAIAALSHLADDPAVTEAEINPLLVRAEGEGVVAVDAVARRVVPAEKSGRLSESILMRRGHVNFSDRVVTPKFRCPLSAKFKCPLPSG